MQKLNIEKLRKIAALMDSPSEGERSAAMERARDMLASAGKGFRDLPELLAARSSDQPTETTAPPSGFYRSNIFDGFEGYMEEKHPGYKAEQTRQKAEKARQAALFKAATTRKYGSREAVLADDDRQRAIEAAAAPLKRVAPIKFTNGTFDRETLDGWYDMVSETMPETVERAIRAALPFPTTVTAAKAELDYWDERNRELEAMHDDFLGDTALSLSCKARRDLVRDAFETGIRAGSVKEIEIRQRYLVELESSEPEIERAVLLDLQHLSGQPSVQNGHLSTTERRAEVEQMLSNMDTADLSDREIARRVGVSPQTVGISDAVSTSGLHGLKRLFTGLLARAWRAVRDKAI